MRTYPNFQAAFAVVAVVLAGCSGTSTLPSSSGSHSGTPESCERIRQLASLSGTAVEKSEFVAAGFSLPGNREVVKEAFCRVQASARPSNDSEIRFEVWMPPGARWNGRFLAAGGGGNSGAIMYSRLLDGLTRGYATLSTDNGHVSRDGNIHEQSWAIGHPEKVIDFGYRAQHVTALAGKELVRIFYGQSARKSYWIGCSQGGGKGLMQAQRYPQNFDGIVAGAPVFDWIGAMFGPAWVSVKGMREPSQLVPREKLPMIHKAVLAACDASDGLADGLLQEPMKCRFDPAALACKPGQENVQCLTPGEVTAMKRFYEPIRRGDGTSIFPGNPLGSELTSAWLGRSQPGNTSWSWLWRGPVFEDANFDIVGKLDVDGLQDYDRAKQKLGHIYDAVDADLSRFASRNGKLIIWHGWQDELVTALRTQEYVEEVRRIHGVDGASTFMRAYFVPGVNHCRGGAGPIPDEYDMLSKVVDWVEKGEAPGALNGIHRNAAGNVDRTMPICPYPQVARYDGSGPSNAASSFSCSAP
jgi:feruloyl esterase